MMTVTYQTVQFDGHVFEFLGAHDVATLVPFLYLAHKARRGDAVAAELLDSFRMVIRDKDGRDYWPVEKAEPDAVVTQGKPT